jgi:hypothetical protein
MAVSDTDRLDQVAVGPNGELMLVMIEDRFCRGEGSAILDEEFRQKLNTYIHTIRSGYVRQLAQGSGILPGSSVEIVLYCAVEPSAEVKEMIKMVNSSFSSEQISIRWESSTADAVGGEAIEQALVNEAIELIGDRGGWDMALLWVNLVGEEWAAGVQVRQCDGSVENIGPSDLLLCLLAEHKRISYDEQAGAWLSGRISIVDAGRYMSRFSESELLEGAPSPSAADIVRELEIYPRATEAIPTWMDLQVG